MGALLPYICDKITSGKECVFRNKSLETLKVFTALHVVTEIKLKKFKVNSNLLTLSVYPMFSLPKLTIKPNHEKGKMLRLPQFLQNKHITRHTYTHVVVLKNICHLSCASSYFGN